MKLKKKYRSRIQIIADILSVIEDEGGKTGVTRILYGANLSYDRLMKYLSELIDGGLIRKSEENNKSVYILTKKGYEFLREFRKIKKFAEAFGIRI